MKRVALLLAALVGAGSAVPAAACRVGYPVFNGGQPSHPGEVQVRVHMTEMLMGLNGRPLALRGTVVIDKGDFRAGQTIVVIVPTEQPEGCYFGFASASAIQVDGSILASIAVEEKPEPSGAFAAIAAAQMDRRRYARLGTLRGAQWVPARFSRAAAEAEE